MSTEDVISPTPYQAAILNVPEQWNLMLAGGRGGGKSFAAVLLVLRHVEKYGRAARPLVLRETHKAIQEFEDELDRLLGLAYRGMHRHNRADHVFRLPNGAVIECGQLDRPDSYRKYQGRSFTLLVVEEFGNVRERRWVDLLKSNLRAEEGIPLREIRTANPGGPQHAYIHMNWISAAPAWHPFDLDGERWVTCPSTYTDNPHLDHDDYERRIRAACGQDEALARAWLAGDWNISRGAFFAGVLSEQHHMLPAAWHHPLGKGSGWRPFIAMDWGSAAPSVAYLCLQAPGHLAITDPDPERTGSMTLPKDSLILHDEVASVDPYDPNLGLNWPPSKLAEAIKEMCGRWGVPHVQGVGDDAYGLADSLLNTLRGCGVHLVRPKKERVSGWASMRQLLHSARERDGRPGMWISERCRYFWQTVPHLQRDPLRPEDMMSDGPDHAADAARYAVMHRGQYAHGSWTVSMY